MDICTLKAVLAATPSSHTIMLKGPHGIGKTEVMSWIGMDDDEATLNVFKAMVKKQNKYNNDMHLNQKKKMMIQFLI